MAVVERPAELIPRRYQEEVFVQAQKRNIVAALDTGSGKTFISTLLIKWIQAQATSYNKSVVFLVPKVTLAEQQAEFIARNTSFRVLKLYGAMEVDLTDRVGWERKFAQHDVIVVTPQVFFNLVTHSVWQMTRVSLLVFDECHHARKNHPYNMIMREYRNVQPSKRPKVFGMTASPILNPNQAEKSLKELEANMDSVVIGVNTNTVELEQNSPRPDEVVRVYPSPPLFPSCPLMNLWSTLNVFPILRSAQLAFEWEVIERRYNITLHNLGPFSAAMYLHHEIWTRIQALILQNSAVYMEDLEAILPTQHDEALSDDIYHVAEVLLEYTSFFSTDCQVEPEWCTPKVCILAEIILQHNSPTFQGIIFVEQRQVAACLARVLPNLPDLRGLVRCAALVGHNATGEGAGSHSNAANRESVQAFRQKKVNLLIATSVAEEGLDFPACDLVIRFDKVQHLVGYVQSRGRARNKTSTFIVMAQENEIEYLKKFNTLSSSEPALKAHYQVRAEDLKRKETEVENEQEEDVHPADMEARERYVVSRTGAFVSYDNAISLLGYLCALIPVDKYTIPQLPEYTDDFRSILRLPVCLPLAPEDLVFTGPRRHSKKEAKRAVAFMAAKRLHQLDVLDDYLLPVASKKGKGNEDLEGRPLITLNNVPSIMNVKVRDPWTINASAWVHTIYIDDLPVAGLITGTDFPPVSVRSFESMVNVQASKQVEMTAEERDVMDRFTRTMVWHINTAKDVTNAMALYLVPLNHCQEPDYESMKRLLQHPFGSDDWTFVKESQYESCMVVNRNQHGRPYVLGRIRHDLTPQSPPPLEATNGAKFATYYEYWKSRWTRKNWHAVVPTDGPLVEVTRLPRFNSGKYNLDPSILTFPTSFPPILLPLGCCGRLDVSWAVLKAYRVLPHLTRRLCDIYRARAARFELGLPPILDDLLVQALTGPGTGASFNNQRLETLGDAVLELCTTVHLFNKFPRRHEGQLDIMRQNCISNRFLMTRALEMGLERFISSEGHSVKVWRYVLDDVNVDGRWAMRETPRRSLQDCMEATIGAAFATGGLTMALQAGVALGMSFGGPSVWSERYGPGMRKPVPPMFWQLQHDLGFKFRDGRLLVQALTHPSFVSLEYNVSYQRLEFLGDALLDLVVVDYLFRKFPKASSAELHVPKATVICAPSLAYLAVKRLKLQNVVLINSVELSIAIDDVVPVLDSIEPSEMVKHWWKYHAPKAMSDVFESIMGAILVDTGYNYELTAAVVENVLDDLLSVVSPAVRRDPVTELYQWVAKSGCMLRPNFVFTPKGSLMSVSVSLHDVHLVGPIVSHSTSTAKFMASERSLALLKDTSKALSMQHTCTCNQEANTAPADVTMVE